MSTLSLKPNSRKTPPLEIPKPSSASSSAEWQFKDVGVMIHSSGFSIQFFNAEECEITNIPKDMPVTSIRTLTSEAIKIRSRRHR